jgi:hypothetical protein
MNKFAKHVTALAIAGLAAAGGLSFAQSTGGTASSQGGPTTIPNANNAVPGSTTSPSTTGSSTSTTTTTSPSGSSTMDTTRSNTNSSLDTRTTNTDANFDANRRNDGSFRAPRGDRN